MAQLVDALRYKPEGSGFDSKRYHWKFHRHNPSDHTRTLGSTLPLTEMSTKKGGQYVVLTTLPPSCAEGLEIWESQPPGTLWARTAIALLSTRSRKFSGHSRRFLPFL